MCTCTSCTRVVSWRTLGGPHRSERGYSFASRARSMSAGPSVNARTDFAAKPVEILHGSSQCPPERLYTRWIVDQQIDLSQALSRVILVELDVLVDHGHQRDRDATPFFQQ